MSEALEKLLAQEPIKEPAKRWRNWWKVTVDAVVITPTRRVKQGDIFGGDFLWPSKDVAETEAEKHHAGVTKCGTSRREVFEYLGAFPEGERQ